MKAPGGRVTVFPDATAVANEAARRVAHAATRAVEARGRFVIVLAGGSTPRRLYRALGRTPWAERLPWGSIVWTFGDERCVPPDDDASNYRMVSDALLAGAPVDPTRVLRLQGERDPDDAAARYEACLRELFPGETWPRADLVLLGLGDDGHTASLFPGSPALGEERRWVVANPVGGASSPRLTWTFPALNAAREILFLVVGAGKARRLAEVFEGAPHETPHPAEHIRPTSGTLDVLADVAAVAAVERKDRA